MDGFFFKPRLKKKTAVILFACLPVFFLAAAETEPSGLWQKALAVYQKNNDLIPGKMEVFSEMLDRRGRPDSVTKYFFDIAADEQGQARTELTRALKDGRDITAEVKKKVTISSGRQEKSAPNNKAFTISMGDNPFNPDRQGKVTVRAHAEKQFLFGRHCQRFDFSYQSDMGGRNVSKKPTWVGKAWLEEGSGVPIKLEFSFEPLPRHVNQLWSIYLYEVNGAGDWVLKEITFSGQGGILFIKKSFRSTTRFSDYRRWPQQQGEK